MLGVTGWSGYVSSTQGYKTIFPYLGDILGYSILTNIVFIFLYFRKSFCVPVKVAVLGLLGMNMVSIIFKGFGATYNGMYDFYITLFIVLVSLLTLKKWL